MPLTSIPVIYGANALVGPDGGVATGRIVLQPVQETPSSGYTIVAKQITFPLVAGNISGNVETNGQSGLQVLVFEQIDGATNPAPYIVAIPTSGTLDLSIVSRGTVGVTTPLYVPQSALGAPNGVATLDGTGKIPASELPSGSGVLSVTAGDASINIGGTGINPTVAANLSGSGDTPNPTGTAGAAGTSTKVARSDHVHANRLRIVSQNIQTGDVPLPATGGLWQPFSGFELDLPATAGDWVELSVSAMHSASSNGFLSLAVLVGASSIRRYLATQSSTPPPEGDVAWYHTEGFPGMSGSIGFTVTSNDLDGSNVRFIMAVNAGAGTLYASSTYPFNWHAKNFGPHL